MCKRKYVFDHVDTLTGEIIKGIAERVENPIDEVPDNKKHFKPLEHYVVNVPKELVKEKVNSKVYLSDVLLDLGDNCIFEKQLTGCGGTTLALQDERNCIIAMPIIGSVESKEFTIDVETGHKTFILPGTLCIYSGHNDSFETLKGYIEEHTKTGEPIKIVCTYYQVPKLMNRLRGLNDDGTESDSNRKAMCVNWPEWYYYIDEMQAVLRYYGMNFKNESKQERQERKRRIRTMLRYIHYFKHVVFITATPMKEKYFFQEIFDAPVPERQKGNEPLKQLKEFKVVNVKFPKECVAIYKVKRHKRRRVSTATAKALLPYLDPKYKANAHIFINSLDGILEILKLLNVAENGHLIKIVCGRNEENLEQLKEAIKTMIENVQKKKGSAISFEEYIKINKCEELVSNPISSITEKPKKINFYTSTAFEGADIFDENGKTIVVSYGFRANTMYDISTLFRQIAGRIRDTKFFDIDFFFDGIRYEKDKKDGKSEFERGIQTPEGFVLPETLREEIFKLDPKTQTALFRTMKPDALNNMYVSEYNDQFFFDVMLQDTDLSNADTWNDYKWLSNKVIEEKDNPFLKNGMGFVDEVSDYLSEVIEEIAMFPEKKQKPKDLIDIYKYLKRKDDAGIGLNIDEAAALTIIETEYEYLATGLKIIGESKLKEVNYRRIDIESEIRKAVVGSIEDTKRTREIKDFLAKWVPVGDFMSAKDKKHVAQEATKKFKVKIKIEDFFDVVLKTTRDKRFCKEGETKKIPFIVGWKHTLFD